MAEVTGPVHDAKLAVHVNVIVPLDTIVGASEQGGRIGRNPATAWNAGGCTDCDNLGPLCTHHHQMKAAGYWHIITSYRNGSCTWRSPLGRIYDHTPPDLVPPRPPRPPDDEPPF